MDVHITPSQRRLADEHRERKNKFYPVAAPRIVAVAPKPEPEPIVVTPSENRVQKFHLVDAEPPEASVWPSVRVIVAHVAARFGVAEMDIYSARRTRESVLPRQVAMYLAKSLTLKSLPEIGRRMNRDHTTILHGVRKIEAMMKADARFFEIVTQLRGELAPRETANDHATAV